jgi:hypothetical protein
MLFRPTKMPNGTTQLSMTNAVHRNTSAKPVICLSSIFRIDPLHRVPRQLRASWS